MRVIPILTKTQAAQACGTLTQTSKMPCKSYSLPVVACITGFKMAQIPDSICSHCYADKGFYRMYSATVEPAQHTSHWLPTREYAIVKAYIDRHGSIPDNLTIRLSAMYFDKPVIVPKSLQGVAGIEVSNAHRHGAPMGETCNASDNGGKCGDCRHCFHRTGPVSYPFH